MHLWLRNIGWAEGTSFVLLLFIAVPMKWLAGDHTLVPILGRIHGGLFLLYVATAILASRVLKWRWQKLAQALVASVLPFGPFIFEARLQRQRDLIELAESY